MQMSRDRKVRRNAAEWAEIINRFPDCNMSRVAFCRQEKINPGSFDRWQKKLVAANTPQAFVDITPPAKVESSEWAVEIELASGAQIRLRG